MFRLGRLYQKLFGVRCFVRPQFRTLLCSRCWDDLFGVLFGAWETAWEIAWETAWESAWAIETMFCSVFCSALKLCFVRRFFRESFGVRRSVFCSGTVRRSVCCSQNKCFVHLAKLGLNAFGVQPTVFGSSPGYNHPTSRLALFYPSQTCVDMFGCIRMSGNCSYS